MSTLLQGIKCGFAFGVVGAVALAVLAGLVLVAIHDHTFIYFLVGLAVFMWALVTIFDCLEKRS